MVTGRNDLQGDPHVGKKYDLNGKVVLITGATGGIGAASARALYTKGANLVLTDLSQQSLDLLAAEFDPARVLALPLDVTDAAASKAVVLQTVEHFGRLDIAFANAGIAWRNNPATIASCDEAEFEKIIDVDLFGVWRTLRAATHYRELMKFLVARMFYADGMAALLALGAVYVALFLGWNFLEMLCYAIFASACAFAGGLIGGWLESKVGVKRALLVEIMLMVLAGLTQLSITRETLFLGLIENSQVWDGPVFQTLSDIVYLSLISVVAITVTASISSGRTMLVTLAPPGRSGEFFGIYAIAGTITVWMGPLLVEQFTLWSGDQRIGMVSINILFIIGFATLLTVRMPERAA